jgi:murein DD-endopeptidase MepM/ murein hydrolase activator NlpD
MKKNACKITAFFLSLIMIFQMLVSPAFTYKKVSAAESVSLSVTSFATKKDLMTAFSLDGYDDTVGKITFGKNSKGETQEWYIAGKDNGVSGDNVILFAAEPILASQMFNSDRENKQFYYAAKTGYGNTGGKISVYANHYGVSTLRAALNELAEDTQYFTLSEQTLMNKTTVSTKDTKNNVEYTTSDKLYALSGNYDEGDKLFSGSDDSVEISSLYWDGGKSFWLRTAYDEIPGIALLAIPGNGVVFDYVNYGDSLQPSLNLDISSVAFAASATPAFSESKAVISESMTLRYDGTSSKISSKEAKVTSTATADIGGISVSKSDTGDASDLFLCVQGNDGEGDWVYSKQITEDTVITADDIKSECKLSDIDLSMCKVWLETTVDGLTYARLINVFDEHHYTLKDSTTVDITDKNYSPDIEYYQKCSVCGELNPLNSLAGYAMKQIGNSMDTYAENSSNEDWNMSFLIYCMNEKKYFEKGYFTIPESQSDLKEQIIKNGWYNYSFKQASPGDIAFMKIDGSEKAGIVSRTQEDKIYVVMGDYKNSTSVKEIKISRASRGVEMFGHIDDMTETSQWNYIQNVVLASGGIFIWPVSGENYTVTSCYGPRVLLGGTYHYGTDISCPTGTPIVAVMDGVVADAGYSSSMGNYVVINHAGGYQTTYMHNSSIVANTGTTVAAGTVIALSGSTGQSTGPHCHIKVTLNGSTVDPAPYLGIPSTWTGNASGYVKNN